MINRRHLLAAAGVGAAASGAALISAPTAAAAGAPTGTVNLDDFAGSTDDDKLTAALSYAQAQTRIPWVQLPGRDVTFSQTRTLFSGLKIAGAGPAVGPKNLELAGGKYAAAQVNLNVGNGASSWLTGSGNVFDVCLAGIAFNAANGSAQLLDQATGTLYACEFSNLTLNGFKYGFGNPARKCLTTQVIFSGHWSVISGTDTQFTMGGSDNSFWESGYCNFGPPYIDGGGKPQIVLDYMQNTGVGYMYLTCNSNWAGLQVFGNATCAVKFWGGAFEGENEGRLATAPLIDIRGGNNAFYSPWLAYVASSAQGAIKQSGGNVKIYSPTYQRASATSSSFPLLYQTGGTFQLDNATNAYNEPTYLRLSNGTTATAPAPSNRLT